MEKTKTWKDLSRADKIVILIGVLVFLGYGYGVTKQAQNLDKKIVQTTDVKPTNSVQQIANMAKFQNVR